MDKKEAYKIVFEDIMATDIGLFKGRYDAANGMSEYMNGVWTVMEYIANHISEECCDEFNDMFAKNLVDCEERAKNEQVS